MTKPKPGDTFRTCAERCQQSAKDRLDSIAALQVEAVLFEGHPDLGCLTRRMIALQKKIGGAEVELAMCLREWADVFDDIGGDK